MAKRFFYFFIGITIGSVFIYFLLLRGKDFDFWMPGERVKTEIIERKFSISDLAFCQIECLSENKDSLNSMIKSSEVNFKESKVHEKPCKIYLLETNNKKMEFAICDSTVILNSFTEAGKACNCTN